MIKKSIFVFAVMFSLNFYAQVNFEKGYTIDNEIENKSTVDQTDELKIGHFLIRAKAGISFNSLQIDAPDSYLEEGIYIEYKYPDFKFDSGKTCNVGFDLEYIFPSNKNRWSVFSAFEYHSKYKSNKEVLAKYNYYGGIKNNNYYDSGHTRVFNWNVAYDYFDFGLGIRHYVFLNDNSKLFLNVSGNYSVDFNSKVKNYDAAFSKNAYAIGNSLYFGFGLGYCHKKYSIEFKYDSNRNILEQTTEC